MFTSPLRLRQHSVQAAQAGKTLLLFANAEGLA